MVAGQDVFSHRLDVAALNAAQARLEQREVARSNHHAGTLRDVLELHRIHRRAGWELNTVAQVALSMGCSEHRAQDLLDQALMLLPLPGALEALECGLMSIEQSRTFVKHLQPLPLEHRLRVWALLQARLIADAACASVLPPARLAERLRAWIIQTDPAGAEQRRTQAEAHGSVDYRRREDGLVDINLLGLNGPDAQGCLQNIRRHADDSTVPDDARSAGRRLLDAARDLLLGRTPFVFDEQPGHCRPGCDCRPGQPAPCGADIALLVPSGAGLDTTDEVAELVGHGPIEPDLLHDLLMASPVLHAVFVDEHGVPIAYSPRVERPPRNDTAAVREAILRLVNSPPGPHQPRHPGDHLRPDPGPPGGGLPQHPRQDPAPRPSRPPGVSDLTLLAQIRDRARAAADAARPTLLAYAHPADTPGSYRPSRRLARFLRVRAPRCEWPGCGARATRCDLDHDLAHPDGPTCACNIGPLCRRHHRIKQNGWTKLRARDGSIRWTSPTGRTWTSPSQHQPPQPPVRPLPPLPSRESPLDQLSPLSLEHELRALDPGSPLWNDPDGLELRVEDLEPHQVDPDPPRDTHWTTDLDDPYAWEELLEPVPAAP